MEGVCAGRDGFCPGEGRGRCEGRGVDTGAGWTRARGGHGRGRGEGRGRCEGRGVDTGAGWTRARGGHGRGGDTGAGWTRARAVRGARAVTPHGGVVTGGSCNRGQLFRAPS